MPQSQIKSKLQFWAYRISTILKSFKAIYTLPPEKFQAFVDSYALYDLDWAKQDQMIQQLGPDYEKAAEKKTVESYSVLTHLCAIGQIEKMYIPPAMDLSKGLAENQTLFEQKMFKDLGIKKGSRVLDIGCGRGRVANHVATFTGAHVTGLNIDPNQLESARKYAAAKGMSDQCEFKFGNVNETPFPIADNSLDAVYEIQVFSYSNNLEKLFKEIHRVLKPGGKFACLEWIVLDAYDDKNPEHARLMGLVKQVILAIGNPTIEQYVKAMEKAGFEILVNENVSIDGLQAPLIENAHTFYTRLGNLLKFLVRCKILPAHFKAIFERLSKGGQEFVEADRMRLVTTSHYFVARKKKKK